MSHATAILACAWMGPIGSWCMAWTQGAGRGFSDARVETCSAMAVMIHATAILVCECMRMHACMCLPAGACLPACLALCA